MCLDRYVCKSGLDSMHLRDQRIARSQARASKRRSVFKGYVIYSPKKMKEITSPNNMDVHKKKVYKFPPPPPVPALTRVCFCRRVYFVYWAIFLFWITDIGNFYLGMYSSRGLICQILNFS